MFRDIRTLSVADNGQASMSVFPNEDTVARSFPDTQQ